MLREPFCKRDTCTEWQGSCLASQDGGATPPKSLQNDSSDCAHLTAWETNTALIPLDFRWFWLHFILVKLSVWPFFTIRSHTQVWGIHDVVEELWGWLCMFVLFHCCWIKSQPESSRWHDSYATGGVQAWLLFMGSLERFYKQVTWKIQ